MTTGAHLSEPGGDRDPSRPNVGPFEPPQSEPVIPPQSELPAVPPVPEPAPFPPVPEPPAFPPVPEPPAFPPVPEPPAFPPVPPWRPPEPRYQKEASGDLVRGVLERARLKRGVGMAWPRVSGPAGVPLAVGVSGGRSVADPDRQGSGALVPVILGAVIAAVLASAGGGSDGCGSVRDRGAQKRPLRVDVERKGA